MIKRLILAVNIILGALSLSLADEPVTLERIVISRPSSGGYPAYTVTAPR